MISAFTRDRIDDFGAILNDTRYVHTTLQDDSALLKHELAYCLGQTQNKTAVPFLVEVLEDVGQETIVRHEAGEALGAIGDMLAFPILEKYSKDSCQEIAETCQLAMQRIRWICASGDKTKSPYQSIDPTAAALSDNIAELGLTLVDPTQPLWDRYCAMFKLRNIHTDASIEALCQGLYCEDSALFRHEVAYALGQAQSPVAIKALKDRLILDYENLMVRHECAEALGAIATEECRSILQKYAKDEERVVRESCEVALDMADYENSDELQHAMINE